MNALVEPLDPTVGVGLQDLAVASVAAKLALAQDIDLSL